MILFNENNRKATDFFVNVILFTISLIKTNKNSKNNMLTLNLQKKIKMEIRLPKSHQTDLAADRSGRFAQSSRNDREIFRKEIEKMKIIKNSQNRYNMKLKTTLNTENSPLNINNNSEFRISKRPQQIIRNNKQLLKFKNKVIEIVDDDDLSKRAAKNAKNTLFFFFSTFIASFCASLLTPFTSILSIELALFFNLFFF